MAYVATPDEACIDGVLKPMYDSVFEGDVHHGNPSFGSLQWRAVAEHFGALEKSA